MRFKPPPPASDIGWRVEFRSMDLQLTDHENAAYSSFIVLLTRAILHFNLNFYIPLSKNDENMKKFYLRFMNYPPEASLIFSYIECLKEINSSSVI